MTENLDGYEAIAIVGMSGRFPMAADVDEYWENLRSGRECLTEFTEEEIVSSGVARETLVESRRRTRGVLDGATDFDPGFFGYSPREAEIMDPQQRVFLEVAWQALEDAGYDSERPPGPIGVFAGSGINTYFATNVATRPDVLGPFGMFPAVVLNEKDFIATRVSYAMDLRGPAITVQTACSTSLVAVCYAAQSLLNYECDMAIAGGSAVVFPQTHSSIHEEGGMISHDGHCRPFDGSATGTLFSDGAGAVILRRLSDAIEDGDNIRAVIRGFAVNNDGSGKAGYTAPSVEGQAEVIQLAQEIAGVSPDSISYVEAHGTATPLGDPIEIAALTEAFRRSTDRTGFCRIGSVKSNIGHLDVAAGIAGLIKTTLALEHRQIPPSINFDEPNPRIDWESTPFRVVDRLTDWESETPRRAGVSSFGIGGTNAHLIVEEAPASSSPEDEPRSEQLLVISARTAEALETATANLAEHLAVTEDDLADIAHTLQAGRRQFQHRRAVVAEDASEAAALLRSPRDRRVLTAATHHRRRPVVFMFSGQGSQYVNMAQGLYEAEPLFRSHVDRCAEILEPLLDTDIREIIYPDAARHDEAAELLRQTAYTQPALFVIEHALALLWQSWGVSPAALVGHSIGEYVAACHAGVFSVEDALALVTARGRLMQSLPAGAMLAVPLTEAEIEPWLDDRLCIGVINSEGMCVVSGETEAVDELEQSLAAKDIFARPVNTSHAFHSPMMEPILEEFRVEVSKAQPKEPKIPLVSNLTGKWMTPDQALDPDYWVQHLRNAVRFSDCLATLLDEPERAFLEVGPGRTLGSLARMHPAKTSDTKVISSTRHPEEERSDTTFILEAAGEMWSVGVPLDWAGLHGHRKRRRVSLPTYPFERQRYVLEPGQPLGHHAPTASTADTHALGNGGASVNHDASATDAGAGTDRPEEELEGIIARIWEDLLGVRDVGPDESFFDLGGTSLTAARMMALLAERCGRRLPLSTLVNASTIPELADVLREGEQETPSLVEVKRGDGTRPPLFLIHTEGGHILMYRDLAEHFGPEWTIYGVQSRGLDGVSDPSDSVEEMAATYLAEIRQIQPEGPYYFGGWCLGGTIGYEMAKQLEAVGEKVAWLGMIQARHTEYWKPRDRAPGFQRLAWRASERVSFESDMLAELKGAEKLQYVGEKARRLTMKSWARLPVKGERGPLVADMAASQACDRAHQDAYWAYDPEPYAGRVVIIRSSVQPNGVEADPTLGWGRLLQGEVELYEIPAHHRNIIDGSRGEMAADIIQSSIYAALQEDTSA